MTTFQLILQTVLFAYVLWLGLYLISRDPRAPKLLYAGAGAVLYSVSLALDLLQQYSGSGQLLARLSWPMPLLLSAMWGLAILSLRSDEGSAQGIYQVLLPSIAIVLYGVSAATGLVFNFEGPTPSPSAGYAIFVIGVVGPLIIALGLLTARNRARTAIRVLALATLFVLLGSASMLLPLNILPRSILLISMGFDFALFGVAMATVDAHGQGEALLPHFIRSLDSAFVIALVFGGQVGLVMLLSTGVTLPMLILLMSTISAAIALQTFADPVQQVLDNIAFSNAPRLRDSRTELRNLSSNLPRAAGAPDLHAMDDDEFIRLTRRALSNLGNLPRLATSPLTTLPAIDARLAARGAALNTLERSIELKAVLTDSIERLKPADGSAFGTSDEWRYYNALYFPYVCGIKPYSQRSGTDSEDQPGHIRDAIQWFQTQVPERTLHNWQNAAAKLIATHLRENWQ